jgi:hypothetical protein
LDIRTLNSEFEFHHNHLRAIASICFTELCHDLIAHDKDLFNQAIDSIHSQIRINSLSRDVFSNDGALIEELINTLLFCDITKDNKTQGGYGILLNSIMASFKNKSNITFFRMLSLFAAVDFGGVYLSLSSLCYFRDNVSLVINSYSGDKYTEYLKKMLVEFSDFIDGCNNDTFIFVSSDESRYSDSDGCFDLLSVMESDSLLEKFRSFVLNNDVTELDDIDSAWFDDILTDEQKIEHLRTKYVHLSIKIDDLYFNNNYNIMSI